MLDLPTRTDFPTPARSHRRRSVAPEILDTLPAASPEARRARRDLRIFNRFMGNERWFGTVMRTSIRPGERILEIGAGSGCLARRLRAEGFKIDALDRCPPPANWPAGHRWHQVDVRSFDGWNGYNVVISNLFLHHLTPDELGRIGGSLAAHARLIIASEPARRRRFHHFFSLLCLLCRASAVSRHDGHTSIAAGFSSDELARELRLPRKLWTATSRVCGRGAYHFVATKKS